MSRGGTGAISFTSNRLLIGNGTSAITEDADLTWSSATNTLTTTNIAGSGTVLNNLNSSNVNTGILSFVNGGTGLNVFSPNFILYGSSSNGITTSTYSTYDPSILTLKTERIMF